MTLILWKAPVVREAEDVEPLLKPFYDRSDDSAFEPSPAIEAMAEDLKRLYPWRLLSNEETVAQMSDEDRAQYTPEGLREIAFIEDIERLAREHGLVLYDPQGPDVHLPDDPIDTEPTPAPTLMEALKFLPLVAILLAATYAAWLIPYGWLRWPAMVVTGFITSAALFVAWLTIGGALGLIKNDD